MRWPRRFPRPPLRPAPAWARPARRPRASDGRSTWRKSWIAAPVGLVTTAIRRTNRGSGRLWAGSKSPSRAKLVAKLPQGQFQGPDPRGLDLLDDQLVAAPRGVDVEVPAADDLQAVVQVEPQPGGRVPPDDGPQLGPVVLERQVAVARLRPREVRDLAGHPDRRETTTSSKSLIWAVSSPDREDLRLAWSWRRRRSWKQIACGHRRIQMGRGPTSILAILSRPCDCCRSIRARLRLFGRGRSGMGT